MLWFFLTFGLIGLWAIYALRVLPPIYDDQPIPHWRITLRQLIDEPEEAAIVFFLLGVITAVGGYAIKHGWGTWGNLVDDFYANVAMECFSIAVTVLIIERLYNMRSEKEEKERLILQMGSSDNGFAIEAVKQLGKKNWLYDGSLNGAKLIGANLSGADLRYAKLIGVDLRYADLRYANLRGSHGFYMGFPNLAEAVY